MDEPLLELLFEATIIEWRGPAPFYFAPIPSEDVTAVRDAARQASYGWGCVPVEASIAGQAFTTSLFPRDGGYLLPIKAAARRAFDLAPGDDVMVTMTVSAPR